MGIARVSQVELARRVERLCQQTFTAKSLREQIVGQVRRAVPFDAYNFPLTDPATCVATSPLADVPMLPWPRLPELIKWRYLSPICRWDYVATSGRRATTLLNETHGQPELSPVWQHVQRELGVVDTAIVVFADRYGCWGLLDLWRTTAPFSPAEVQSLSTIADHVSQGLRRAVARTFVDSSEQLHPLGPAVIVLDEQLRVRTQTEAAGTALLQLNPPDELIAPIPQRPTTSRLLFSPPRAAFRSGRCNHAYTSAALAG